MSSPSVERLSREDIVMMAANFMWLKKMPKWTTVVEGRELPARPLVLAAAGVAPNDPTNSHMAIAKLKALGFETRYDGQEHSGAEPVLRTSYAAKELTHRELWRIVEEQSQAAGERERGWFGPSLVAMVFAFHTVEAYFNFIGEAVAPDVWKDERNFFRKEPYRGFEGKARKIFELLDLKWSPETGPLKTILELKSLRDLIAHGRSERMAGEFIHGLDSQAAYPVSTLRSLVVPREKLERVLRDVEAALDEIHKLAIPRVEDVWFGEHALRGTPWYNVGETTLADD